MAARRKTTNARKQPATQLELNPLARRIGPIFDPAWLKLVDERTLREIAVLQLDGLKEMLEVERRTVDRIRNTLVGKRK